MYSESPISNQEARSVVKSAEPDVISLKDLVAKLKEWRLYLLSKWIIILTFAVLGGICGYTYSSLSKPVYTATATFALEEGGESGGLGGQYSGLASMVGIDVGGNGGMFKGDNLLELYKSRSMIKNTLLSTVDFKGKRQLLIDRYIEFNGLRAKWDKKPYLRNLKFTDSAHFGILQDSVISSLAREINKKSLTVIKPDKKLSIIKVTFLSKDELFAKAFTNEIVSNVNNFYIETKTKKSSDNVNVLQRQTDSIRRVLTGAVSSVAASRDVNPNPNPSRQVLGVPSQRKQIDVQANVAVLTELVKNLEISKVSLRKETPLIQIIDDPVLPLEKEKLGVIEGIAIGWIIGSFIIIAYLCAKRLLTNL